MSNVIRPRSHLTPTIAVLLLLLPTLTGGKCKCKGEPEQETDQEVPSIVQPIEVPLQIVSINPDVQPPDTAFIAQIFGAGFEDGAALYVDQTEVTSVTFEDPNALSVRIPGLPEGVYDVVVENPDGGRSTLRSGLLIEPEVGEDCRFVRVMFGYDESTIGSSARQALSSKLNCYEAMKAKIRVEGHTDERGTVDYNLSLGQRRADAVGRYLTSNGVRADRVNIISYGKERPVDDAHSESAWEKNRRADVHAGN